MSLSDSFFARYANAPSPLTPLGEFVYTRTYSAWLPHETRRERWAETVRRAVDYNCSLAPTPVEEAEKLFDNIFHTRQFVSGRTLWVGGREVAYKYPTANYNCSSITIDSFDAIRDVLYMLTVGTGVGFRVLPEDVNKLPKINPYIVLDFLPYKPVAKAWRQEQTTLTTRELPHYVEFLLTVGDSKEGWADAVRKYFEVLEASYALSNRPFYDIVLRMEFSHVRPAGERLKTMGGRASGPEALMQAIANIHATVSNEDKDDVYTLRPVDVLDICNAIAEAIVVGGVRRSSEIALGAPEDDAFINAKVGINDPRNKKPLYRYMSNNSIMFEHKPTRERLHGIFQSIKAEGEPGFVNAEAARKRRPNFQGLNPCAEILLDSHGLCNLTTVNVRAFVKPAHKQGYYLDTDALFEAQRLSARAGVRMTMVTLELPEWDKVQKRDRLVGCSLTGWQDAMGLIGLRKEQQAALLTQLRGIARTAAFDYADELGIPRPLLVTTVKPEGSLSQVAGGVSSGVHYSHAPAYIRRIRVSAQDPVAKAVMALGWDVVPEVGSTWENARTLVVSFPVISNATTTKYDVSAVDQLDNYKMFQRHYTDHNTSITVSVREDEWEEVEQWVWDNWDDVVAISFLSLDNHTYQLAPYEARPIEEIVAMQDRMAPFDPGLVQQYEEEESETDLNDPSCDTGICPVR